MGIVRENQFSTKEYFSFLHNSRETYKDVSKKRLQEFEEVRESVQRNVSALERVLLTAKFPRYAQKLESLEKEKEAKEKETEDLKRRIEVARAVLKGHASDETRTDKVDNDTEEQIELLLFLRSVTKTRIFNRKKKVCISVFNKAKKSVEVKELPKGEGSVEENWKHVFSAFDE